jgi:hypothetical protein
VAVAGTGAAVAVAGVPGRAAVTGRAAVAVQEKPHRSTGSHLH